MNLDLFSNIGGGIAKLDNIQKTEDAAAAAQKAAAASLMNLDLYSHIGGGLEKITAIQKKEDKADSSLVLVNLDTIGVQQNCQSGALLNMDNQFTGHFGIQCPGGSRILII